MCYECTGSAVHNMPGNKTLLSSLNITANCIIIRKCLNTNKDSIPKKGCTWYETTNCVHLLLVFVLYIFLYILYVFICNTTDSSSHIANRVMRKEFWYPNLWLCFLNRHAQLTTPSSRTWLRPTTRCIVVRAAWWRAWRSSCSPASRCCWGPSACPCWTASSNCSKCHRPTPSEYAVWTEANTCILYVCVCSLFISFHAVYLLFLLYCKDAAEFLAYATRQNIWMQTLHHIYLGCLAIQTSYFLLLCRGEVTIGGFLCILNRDACATVK